MALSSEAGELTDVFQWLSDDESRDVMSSPRATEVRRELADVFGYVLRLADVLELDLVAALRMKIAENEEKYPPDLARGNATKYTYLRGPES